MSFTACGTCGKWFNSYRAREQHMDALGHEIPDYECGYCERFFPSRSALDQHRNDKGHWPADCRVCDMGFGCEADRDQHEIDECLYCGDCDRHFMNDNNMRMHRNSRIHRGLTIKCPFCTGLYASATGLCHHLETGSCPNAPSLSRDAVYRLVRSKDPNSLISKKLLGWTGSTHWEASDRTWNGRGYECYLCRRTFTTLHGLNQHLSSPTHQQHLYHCPNRRAGCGHDFRSLAALMNHLESESCGFIRFEKVQHGFRDIISSDKMIAF